MLKKTMRSLSLSLAVLALAWGVWCMPAARAEAALLPSGSVRYVYVQDEHELRQYVDSKSPYASEDILIKGGDETGVLHRLTIEVPGELLIYPLSEHGDGEFQLFSNEAGTSALQTKQSLTSTQEEPYRQHLQPGTYAYLIVTKDREISFKTTVYLGFIPDDITVLAELGKDASVSNTAQTITDRLLFIGMLEDIIESNRFDFSKEPVKTPVEVDAYIRKLETFLRNKGINYEGLTP